MPDENLMQMQREAAERVRQMHARARSFGQENQVRREPEPLTPRAPVNLTSSTGNSFLTGLLADQDQLLLLFLALLLAKNEAPMELILALLYIAM